MLDLTERDGAVTFKVRVQPRAPRSELAGEYAGAIKIRICAPPVDGRANEECKRFLAELLAVSRSEVEIIAGASSRDKVVRVRGIGEQSLRKLLDG